MSWKTVSLGEICNIEIGKTPSRSILKYWGGDQPFMSISDMNQGRYFTYTKEFITDNAAKECNCKLVPSETLLLSFKLSIGKVGITRMPIYTNEAIAALYIRNPTMVYQDYLYWALQNVDYDLYVDKAAKGKTLNKKKLNIVKIPLPPLDEQYRIADILDQADALRQKRSRALARLDDLLQSVFLEMFGDPVTNSRGWDVMKLEEVLSSSPQNGAYYPKEQYATASDQGVEMVHMSAIPVLGKYKGRFGNAFVNIAHSAASKLR